MAYSPVVFPCSHWVELLEGLQGWAEGAAGCVWWGPVICKLEVGWAQVEWEGPLCCCCLQGAGEQGL